MRGIGKEPAENLPRLGTVENPALFSDGEMLLLAYNVAPLDGGGFAILAFNDIIHFEQNPTNVEGLGQAKYPSSPWRFTEVTGSDRTVRWAALAPRFWTISFNDVTVEVVFRTVHLIERGKDRITPTTALARHLGNE